MFEKLRGIKNSLSPVQRVFMQGIGKDNVERVKAYIDYLYPEERGTNQFTDDKLEDKLRAQYNAAVSVGVGLGSQFTARVLQERFQFTTLPALTVGSQVSGDYGKLVISALERAEQYKHEWGMQAQVISSTVVGLLFTTNAVRRVLTGIRSLNMVRRSLNVLKELNVIRQSLRVATTGIRAVGGLGGIPGLILSALASYVVGEIGYHVVVRATEKRAERLSYQEMAVGLLDRDRIMNDYMSYRGVLPGVSGYERFNRLLQTDLYGNALSQYGFSYENMSPLVQQMMTTGKVTDSTLDGYMNMLLGIETLYGRDAMQLVTNMSRITYTKQNEVDAAKEAFQDFFASLVGDGQIHSSYLNLVEELTGFTESYAQGQKFNLNGQKALAQIAQFLFPAFNMQTTAPIQQFIATLDSVLIQGAMALNPRANELLALSGISPSEAARGVTSNADIFNRAMAGIARKIGLSQDSFDGRGNMKEDKLLLLHQYLTRSLDLDPQQTQMFIKPLYSFVSGGRASEVQKAFLEQTEYARASDLADFDFIKLNKGIVDSSNRLSELIMEHTDIMLGLDHTLMIAYTQKVPLIAGAVADMVVHLDKILKGEIGWSSTTTGTITPELNGLVSSAGGDAIDGLYAANASTREFYSRMIAYMSGNGDRRSYVSQLGGTIYDSSDPNLVGRTNVGTDIVIGGRGSSSPVYFPFVEGTVIFSGSRLTRGTRENTYGLSVVVALDDTYSVAFSHLSSITVSVGQKIRHRTLIGFQGETGTRADGSKVPTGPHVDVEFWRGTEVVDRMHTGELLYENQAQISAIFRQFLPSGRISYNGYDIPNFDTEEDNEYNGSSSSVDTSDEVVMDIEYNLNGREGLANAIAARLETLNA